MKDLCPACVPLTQQNIPKKSTIKFLRYHVYTSNLKPLLDGMYAKDPRPNLHAELGYSDAPDSPDRFYADSYDDLVAAIKNAPPITS